MTEQILVTYASRYGSTAEVAEVIASTLRSRGLFVDLIPMNAIGLVNKYRAIIIGSPLFVGKWHKDMRQFLIRYQVQLQEKPVALFTLGPVNTTDDEMQQAEASVDQELKHYSWLKPMNSIVFVGKYDPEKLTGAHKLMAKFPASPLHDLPASDNRNWYIIRLWAEHLADELALNKIEQAVLDT